MLTPTLAVPGICTKHRIHHGQNSTPPARSQSPGELNIEAASLIMTRTFLEGAQQIIKAPALKRLISDLETLDREGLSDGNILGASAVWVDRHATDRFWQVRYTPIRDETGARFVHVTLAGLEDSPAARAAANDAAPRIERFNASES